MTIPAVPFPAPVQKTLEELMDAIAWMLGTSPATSKAQWILGDVGMGAPGALPFGYISRLNQRVLWETNRGQGGTPSSQYNGVDMWSLPIVITIVLAQHQYLPPQAANPSAGSAFQLQLAQGGPLPYMEQEGWRDSEALVNGVLGLLRQNIVVGGFAGTTTVQECKPILQKIDSKLYRCERVTVQAQQRRQRGT